MRILPVNKVLRGVQVQLQVHQIWGVYSDTSIQVQCEDDENFNELMNGELSMIEQSLLRNPKSYGAWHHRTWVMENSATPPWEAEVDLCDKYLKKDERNSSYCVQHQSFTTTFNFNKQITIPYRSSPKQVDRLSSRSSLAYGPPFLNFLFKSVINENMSKKLSRVVEAVFTDPNDQSPWLFLRWLVNRVEGPTRLLQVGYKRLTNEEVSTVCVFSKEVSRSEIPQIKICNGESVEVGSDIWFAPINGEYSHVWFAKHKINVNEGNPVKCQIAEVTLTIDAKPECVWLVEPDNHQEPLSDLTRKTLEEVKENCQTIDELDPGTKWVLLTIVDVMWTLDTTNYSTEITNYLNQLQELDPLRKNYYLDVRSKLIMETALKDFLFSFTPDKHFSITDQNLTRIPLSHLLACATSVDLSNNNLTALVPLANLVLCEHLVLDNNNISDISPLTTMNHLTKISIAGNKLDSVDSVGNLKNLINLKEMTLTGNPLCNLENVEENLKSLLPQITVLNL
ncbi:unnamed protein product, partial [Meganyctiphanes norvegica]